MNPQDFIVRAAASLRGRFGIAFGAERLALDLSQQTATEKAKAHAQLKPGYFDSLGRRALGAFRSSSETSTGRVASTSHFSTAARELDAAIPARFIIDGAGLIANSEINPGQSGRSPPREVLPVLDHLRSPARRLNREQQSTGVPRPPSEPPTRRPSAFLQNALTCALLRRWKQPRPRSGTTAPERRRDD